jgi:hypothetical protein
MSPQRSFRRKIFYLAAILVLLLILIWLGQPATSDVGDTKGSPGGYLAQLRTEYGLSESDLGEIDPASETMKLATLGTRGVAVVILWHQADTYKMKEDWSNLTATLEQIARLEPHFVNVWRFQAWNLAYNVSHDFDDYRERYRYVTLGIDYMRQGVRLNEHEPMLVWDVAWFLSHKIGKADEHKQFRRLFYEDEDFRGRLSDDRFIGNPHAEERDNWLFGKMCFEHSVDMVEHGADLKKYTPVLFYSEPSMCQVNYAEAIEKEGVFGEKAQLAWDKAAHDFAVFAGREIKTSDPNVKIRLEDAEQFEAEAERLVAKIEAFAPGLRDQLKQKWLKNLKSEERKAFETPEEKRTDKQRQSAYLVESSLRVTPEKLAHEITGPHHAEAEQLAKQAADLEAKAAEVRREREIVNFDYWRRHARIERTAVCRAARKLIYDAEQLDAAANTNGALDKFADGFRKWREVLDNPEFTDKKLGRLVTDTTLGSDLMEAIDHYRRLLDKAGINKGELPKDFPLQEVVSLHGKTPR